MIKNSIVLLLLVTTMAAQAQQSTIKSGEKLVYSASYEMSGLMTELARVTMETKNVKTSSATLMHLKCTAVTFSKWDTFFKIRDVYESYVNPRNLMPIMHKRSIDEGGYKKDVKYVFSYKKGIAKSTSQKPNKPAKEKTVKISPATLDVVSTIYQLRTVDFNAIGVGGSKSFSLLFNNKELPVSIKLLGKETVKSAVLGSKECFKLSVSAKTDKLKGKDQNLIWITTDGDHVPVKMKFNIPVGSGELTLKSYTK